MIAYILEDEGYQVISSLNSEPLEDVENHKPNLILLDDWLPDSYGHDLCRELKASPATAHIPVLLISSVRNLQEIALECNADGFIRKPFDIEYLISTVRHHLDVKPLETSGH